MTEQPTGAAAPRVWTISLPAHLELLNENRVRHMHWTKQRRLAREIKEAAAWTARAARIPTLDQAHIAYVVHPKNNGRFDPHNWGPSAKAAVDGLVIARVLVDDDRTHLLGLEARAGHKVQGGQLSLVITEIKSAPDAG